jgi:hypothetical protein
MSTEPRALRWNDLVRMIEAECERTGTVNPEICFIAMTHGPIEDLRIVDGKLCVLE